MTDQPGPSAEADRHCPWCAAPAKPGDTVCSACGAALAQRESIGGVLIPGLTGVDPALEDFDKRPIHLRGPSPSQGVAPALIIGAVAGGPIGLMAIGGVAAVAGAEFLASRHGGPGAQNVEDVGKPSEVLLQALEQEREAAAHPDAVTDPGAGVDPTSASNQPPATAAGAPDAADVDHGMSIWRDLPPADVTDTHDG
jgi:hypothetical protein